MAQDPHKELPDESDQIARLADLTGMIRVKGNRGNWRADSRETVCKIRGLRQKRLIRPKDVGARAYVVSVVHVVR